MKFLKFLPTAIINSIVEKAVETLIERGEISTCFVTPGDKYPFEYGIQGYKIRSMLLPSGQIGRAHV